MALRSWILGPWIFKIMSIIEIMPSVNERKDYQKKLWLICLTPDFHILFDPVTIIVFAFAGKRSIIFF